MILIWLNMQVQVINDDEFQLSFINIIFYYLFNLGAWNDPDMLIIGNFGLSIYQERT